MSYNKSLLSKITEDLAKKPKKVSVPRNQWQHPGEITNIPSGNITMDAVTYPVLGVPNIGEPQMMYPNQQYHYPGADNVTEYPMMRNGGYTVTRSNDRKGKTHKVTGPDGTVKYFGDSKLGQHPKDPERKKAFYARHKHNLDANPYFRAFARATWQNGGELDMPKMQFAGAVAASTSVQNRNRPKTPQELAAYREQIYNTIRPSDYWDQNNYARFLFNNQREEMDDVRSEEGFRQYLGLNTNPRFITPAIYRPTQAKNPNAKYYKVDKALEQDLFDSFHDKLNLGQTMGTDEFQVVNNVPYIKRLHDQGLYNEEDDTYYLTKADQKLKRSKYQSRARVLGNFTVSRGKDNKGEYLSYYDTYDFPNLVQKQMQGSPYEIYGRIYYPKKATGGQTRNEREMVNGIADILSQVKDRENRAQIAANMQADFKRDDVTYDAQKFMQMAKLQNGGGLDQYQYAGSVIDRPVIKADATSRVMPRVLTMQELQRIVENQKRKAAEEAIKKQPRIYADNVPQSTRDAWRRQQEINNYIKNSQIAQTFTSMNGGNEALGAIGAKTAAASMLGAGAAGAGVAGANWLASNVLPYVGPALSTPAAKTIGNLLSAGFATKGVMNLPTVGKSVQTAYQDPSLGNIGNAALETGVTALDLLPAMSGVKSAIGEGVSAINTSKESGLLSNAYKINPWAFKPQQGKIYRQLGQSGIDDAIQQGKVFSKGQKEFLENYPDANYLQDYQTAIDAQDSGTLYLAKPHPAPFFKRDALFFPINRTSRGKGIQSTKFSDAAYLLEGNVPEEALLPRYRHQYLRSGDVGVLRPEFNDLGNFNVYKRDWLRGYKPIEGPNVNITPAATESIPINREALKDAYGFLNRRQFVKNLQKQGLIGKGFTEADARYAARSTDKTNALTKLALDRDATFYRGVEGSVPKDGIGYQDWTGRKFNMSEPAWNNEISEFENMKNAGVDFNDPMSIAEYQASHVPMEQYGYRSGMPSALRNVDALYTSKAPNTYGNYQMRLTLPRDYSQGNYSDWFAKYYKPENNLDDLAIENGYWNKDFMPNAPYETPVTLGAKSRDIIIGPRGKKMFDVDKTYPFSDYKNLSGNKLEEYKTFLQKLNRDYNTGWKGQYKKGGWLNKYQPGGESMYNDVDSTDKAFLTSMDNYKSITPGDVNSVKNNMVKYIGSPLYTQRQANFPENYLGAKGAYQKKKFEDTIARQKAQQRITNIQQTPYHISGTNQVDGNQFNHRNNSLELNPFFDLQGIGHEFGHVANNSMMTNFNGVKNYRPESDYVNGYYWDSITDKTKRPAFSTGLNQKEISQFVDLARPLAPDAMFGNKDPHEDKTSDPVMFADESYGDLMGLRQLLHQKGYTKNFGDNIDQQLMNKALQDKNISNDFIFKRMYNKYGADNMIKLNNTIAYNNAAPSLPMAQEGGTKYVVKPGEYLSQIAKANNISVEDLVLANKISNPNLIKPNQQIIIPKATRSYADPGANGFMGFDQLMKMQEEIANLPTNQERVIEYRKRFNVPGNYGMVDKTTGKMSIYDQTGKQLSQFNVGTGKDVGDAYTINTKGPTRRNSTPAGIFTLTNKGSGRDSYAPHYGNNIWEMVDQNGMQQATALHQVPNELQYRNALIDQNLPGGTRISNGCVNCKRRDFDANIEKYLGKGSNLYILPENDNNYYTVKNNKIMLAGKEFDKDVIYSKKDLTARPIQIKYAKSQFGKGVNNVQALAQSLVNNKQSLMKDLNLDNDTYNQIVGLTLGIGGQESDYGNNWRYKLKENPVGQFAITDWRQFKNIAHLPIDLVTHPFNIPNPLETTPNSRGFTQIKYNAQNKQVRDLFAKYGIKNPDDLNNPNNSAVATAIMLGHMYNNELPQLKKQMTKLNMSPFDALLYLNQGKRREIKNGTATPDQNNYIQSVKKYAKRFKLEQSEEGGETPTNNWLDKYN